MPCDPKGCKIQQITDHFTRSEFLGYSVFVQSSLSQPPTARLARHLGQSVDDVRAEYGYRVEQGHEEIALAEGFLIEAHRRQGEKPKWNKVGGSIEGQSVVYKDEGMLLDCLTGSNTGPILARSTLRTISIDETAATYEEYLHTVRILMLRLGMDFQTAFEKSNDTAQTLERILAAGYLLSIPKLPSNKSS